eukprot:TRINITY_DN2758_c0_g1_i6.p1 TRINITY_DN2758_c0_g1~~TRINITY_DN2758_c0_g1_i6.p1  ORF type:complete len:667 (-),score=138.56 TRINITY_DN2758_c0_g1_i6:304-2304(-)
MANVPFSSGRAIPVIADEYVDPDFGTGALKITPGHDHSDYAIGKRLGLPFINIMNKNGTLNENAGAYSGMDRFVARKRVWSDMEAAGLAIKSEAYSVRVPRSQRGGEVVEPLISKQWFISMEPLANKAKEALDKGDIVIIPERFEKTYNHWLLEIKDWCISRQLWWGHRIPVWHVKGREDEYIVARDETDAYKKANERCGSNVMLEQDPDVLDTWFSSGLWPFSTLGWPDIMSDDFVRFYPNTVLETGHDILFFWVARMIMMGIELTGKVPFRYIYLHGLIRDSQGRKMSKTLGNVIDPIETIKEYGTDALRFTLATGTTPGQDLNLSAERLLSNKAFTNKLWNAGKYILQNLPQKLDVASWKPILELKLYERETIFDLPLVEQWVVTKVHEVVDMVSESYERFYFLEAGRTVYDFFWNDFADWYIEASKARMYNNEDTTIVTCSQAVLVYVFKNILKLLHPFMPYVTETLWQAFPNRNNALIVEQWPKTGLPKDAGSVEKFECIRSLIKAIRNARAEYSVEAGKRISAIFVTTRDVQHYLYNEKDVITLLSRLDPANIQFSDHLPEHAKLSVHIVVREGLEAYLPLEDMVDISKEIGRVSKQLAKLQSDYDGLMKRLASPNFVGKAPETVVKGVREKANELEERLAMLNNRLAFLESASECKPNK